MQRLFFMVYKDYFSIIEYYKKVVVPFNPRKYKVKSDKMMVCPLHDDVNPSMGIIKGKDGEELFHCFGCNQWGNIIELNKKVNRRLFKKYLSDEESLKDLCRLFNVSYDEVAETANKEIDEGIQFEMAIQSAKDRFDISDLKDKFIEGKIKGKNVGYFNALIMMMINELKKESNDID